MVEIIKDFYKQSDKKKYIKGCKATFNKKDESRLIKEGLVKKIVKKDK